MKKKILWGILAAFSLWSFLIVSAARAEESVAAKAEFNQTLSGGENALAEITEQEKALAGL
ncbi:MAG: hypothetical protein ABII89_03920 [Candidatus Omnitrophota bacterium]